MTIRRTAGALACLALLAVIAIGIARLPGGGSDSGRSEGPFSQAHVHRLLAGSPAALASLHAQEGRVLGGGSRALRARLATLKGYPVVINKWASWCVPCKAEFGAFQRVAAEDGRRVAFLGIDSGDSDRSSALAFLSSHPVSYPSYYDPSGQLGEQMTDSTFTPVTVFIPPHGTPYIHQGQYPSAAKLRSDVARYALGT